MVVYKKYNPSESRFFPKCPFYMLTGFKCAGCGSQRALHYLLNGNFTGAIKQNVLLVAAIPYLIISSMVNWINKLTGTLVYWRKTLLGSRAITVILGVILIFWLVRNIIHI